ncbi:MAG: addiction module protein [Armatimonadetes bacterium]|nr:addiction module protein [Armatimonadota bacterium]
MPMTVDEICSEVKALPTNARADIVDRVMEILVTQMDPEIVHAHAATARRRRDEVRSGAVTPIPGKQGLARVREILQ